ncbi:MAG: translation initiation factor IF-2 [Bacteroidota bacterium]
MAGKNKIYRLFKVAKELNVGTTMLVDHLQEKGHSVDNSPNTKLSSELYDMLLKEFASEKLMKEKADQLAEKRKEEVRSTVTPTTTPTPTTEEEQEHISAEDLRNRITPRSRRRRVPQVEGTPPPPVTPPKVEVLEKESVPPVFPIAKETPVKKEETLPPTPEVKVPTPPPSAKEKEPIEAEPPQIRLKVVDKIDLDAINKGRSSKKKEQPAKEKKVAPPKEEAKQEKQEEPLKKEAKLVTPPQKEVEKEPEQQVVAPPVVEVESPPVVEDIVKEIPVVKEVKKTESPQKVEVSSPQSDPVVESTSESEEEDEESVMRAGDRTPKLSGLKVMGKIELPGAKKPKKKSKDNKGKEEAGQKDGKPAETTAKKSEGEEGDQPKKRRRRRKRKRKDAPKVESGSGNSGQNRGKDKKGKKEKPSQTEVDQSIRNTFSQMNRGASRSRQRLRRAKRDADAARRELVEQKMEEDAKIIDVTEFITANEFAQLIKVPVNDIITKSFQLGMMISINQRLDAEVLTLIAEEYGFEANFVDVKDSELEIVELVDDPADLEGRSPIITVMGHVDHGKTTLLDNLRKTNVTSQEAGGITQHIGAYEVKLQSGNVVTFLDTPGHEAFTAMRARGAKVTDLVIIVVAADDAVMPQTREAINHAQAAEVPMIFAINKIDKPGADAERIKGQLAEMNILLEDWGGNFQSQEISALRGTNVDELLEKVILEADLLELKANPNRVSTGTVIEARLDKGRGNVATLLVQNGTLKVGDEMVAGIHYGKVRALIDQNGKRIKTAGPSQPVQVLGLGGQPQAGDRFYIFEEDGKARSISQKRSELFREQQLRQTNRLTLEEIGRRRALGNFEELNIIIRGDVDGSVEALSGSLLKLSTDEVQVNIIMKAVGAISEADINLAMASDAIVIAFNVRPNAQARSLAEREQVDIRTYSVIYNAINDVKDALEGLLSPEIKEDILGTAEIKEVFHITKVGKVAGAQCTSGKINRDDRVRLIRDGVVIYESKLSSLRRFKDDVKEVINGQECGFMVENYQDIKEGDVIEAYRVNEIRRTL